MTRSLFRTGLLGVLVIGIAAPASANLLTNGGFEDGDTGQLGSVAVPSWNSWGGSGWHHDDVGKVIDTKAMKLWWDDAGLYQDVTVTGGGLYDFSVQVFNASDDQLNQWNGLIKAEFYDSSIGTDPGDALANVELERYYSATDPVDTWVEIGNTITAPAGADIGRIVLLIVDWQPDPSGVLNFDEASITLVPEPAAFALLAIATLVLRRRA